MDIFSGILTWLFVVFLQLCPLAHMSAGQTYTYSLDGTGRNVTITVKAFDAKRKSATLIAELDPSGGDTEPRSHYAEIGWKGDRTIKVLKMEGIDLIESPLVLPTSGVLMGTYPKTPYERVDGPLGTGPALKIAGVRQEVVPDTARYQLGADRATVGTYATIGLVTVSHLENGQEQRATLIKVKR